MQSVLKRNITNYIFLNSNRTNYECWINSYIPSCAVYDVTQIQACCLQYHCDVWRYSEFHRFVHLSQRKLGHQHFQYSILLISRNHFVHTQSLDRPVTTHLPSPFLFRTSATKHDVRYFKFLMPGFSHTSACPLLTSRSFYSWHTSILKNQWQPNRYSFL